eukprot:gene12911-19907_t
MRSFLPLVATGLILLPHAVGANVYPLTTWQNIAWCGGDYASCQKTQYVKEEHELVIVDLYETSAATIRSLKSRAGKPDRLVICYYSAGTYEAWRPDANAFSDDVLGNKMSGWDERWLKITSALPKVKELMGGRLDYAVEQGCDGVEPDNVDCYDNSACRNGEAKASVRSAQIEYNEWTASAAHSRGLLVGLKNSLDLVSTLQPHYDFAVNEECQTWDECEMLLPFLNNNKAVLQTEYENVNSDASTNRCSDLSTHNSTYESTYIATYKTNVYPLTTWQNIAWCGGDYSSCQKTQYVKEEHELVIVDLYETSAATIRSLKSRAGKPDRLVICYYSAGTYEAWRPDANAFSDDVLGNKMSGWDERWLKITSALPKVKELMGGRLDYAVEQGCDGVEPDNVDCYDNSACRNGEAKASVRSAQIEYNEWTASAAHSRGLLVGLKNSLDLVSTLQPHYDFAVNEECQTWDECEMLLPFLNNNKAVLQTEYENVNSWQNMAWCGGDGTSCMQTKYVRDADDLVIVDLFDTSADTISSLKKRPGQKDRIIICYYSAGTFENWREDKRSFPASVKGKKMGDWPGEKWLDILNEDSRDIIKGIMTRRLDLAVQKGCDGVEPDNVDCYANKRCRQGASAEHVRQAQIVYNSWTAVQADRRYLLIGLKNALELIPDLLGMYDFAINEGCQAYQECGLLTRFLEKGKAVLHVEYENVNKVCSRRDNADYGSASFSTKIAKNSLWKDC